MIWTVGYNAIAIICHHHQVTLTIQSSLTLDIYHSWRVLYTASSVRTEQMYLSHGSSANTNASISKSPYENVANEFVLTSLAVSLTPYSSNLYGLCDGRLVATQLVFCEVSLPELVQNNTYLCSSHLSVSLASIRCIHTIILTQPLHGRNPILFYQRNQNMTD